MQIRLYLKIFLQLTFLKYKLPEGLFLIASRAAFELICSKEVKGIEDEVAKGRPCSIFNSGSGTAPILLLVFELLEAPLLELDAFFSLLQFLF